MESIFEEMMSLFHPGLKRFVLSPQKMWEFERASMSYMRYTQPNQTIGSWAFMGVPVTSEGPTGTCRNCGAPSEPNCCPYCHSPAEYVYIE